MTDPNLSLHSAAESALTLLRQLEGRFREAALSAPAVGVAAADSWAGILTHCGGRTLVVPLREIREILNFPTRITSIPLTKDWVLGIANNRGSLLPLYDLQDFLFGEPLVRDERTRVLVIEQGQVGVGLVVESSVGMLHLSPSDVVEAVAVEADALSPYVASEARFDGQGIPVLDVQGLLSAEGFRAVTS